MKHIALLLLLAMALLFALTLDRPEPWAGWLHAFAEAGMVGALADWFAVVALFRHPLGIPIPHTAIIPRRKNEIGDNLAAFVVEHFLHPAVVRSRLKSANLASNTAEWLKSPRGHERVLDMGMRTVQWMLGALHEQRVRGFIGRLGSSQLSRVDLAPLVGRTLDWLAQDGRHQEMLTRVLRTAVVMLHDNRQAIRANVQRESPWWIPGFVDDKILVQMMDRIETLLLELSLDPGHEMRGDFDRWVKRWAHELRHSPEYRRWGEQFKAGLLENDALQDYLFGLWGDLVSGLESDLERPDSDTRKQLSALVAGLAEELEQDEKFQAWVNEWLVEATVSIVADNRQVISSLISDTVRGWDATETSQRIESAIGRDLQFIRINGTLVGGLAGLAIHAFAML